jgi:hypothetical protein
MVELEDARAAAEIASKQTHRPARKHLDVASSIFSPDLVSGRDCWFSGSDKGLADTDSIATGLSDIDPADTGQADSDPSCTDTASAGSNPADTYPGLADIDFPS